MNQLTLDLTNPDIASAMKGCKPGEHCEFTVGGTFKSDGKTAVIAVDEVKYTGSDDESKEPADDSDDAPAPKKPKAPPKSKMPPALDIPGNAVPPQP